MANTDPTTANDDITITTTATTNAAGPRRRRTSYLLSYLQKSNLFATGEHGAEIPKFLGFPSDDEDDEDEDEDEKGVTLSPSHGSSVRSQSSISSDSDKCKDRSTRTRTRTDYSYINHAKATPQERERRRRSGSDIENDNENDNDNASDSAIDPDDLTNLPYKSPAVYSLPGLGNGNKFRTLVRAGPVGTPAGENQQFVVIARRSFRGAGLYPRELVAAEDDDVEMQGGNESGVELEVDDADDDDDDEEEEVELEGEVEVMWSEDKEEFWLVRDPTDDGSIGRETSWVAKQWFVARSISSSRRRRRRRMKTGERVELRVSMDED